MNLKNIYYNLINKLFPDKTTTNKLTLYKSLNKLFLLESKLPSYLNIDITHMTIYDIIDLIDKYSQNLDIHTFETDQFAHFFNSSGTIIFDKRSEKIELYKDKYVFRTKFAKFEKPSTFFDTLSFTDYLNLNGLNHILVADNNKITVFTDYTTDIHFRKIRDIKPFTNNQQFDILDISLINNKRMFPYVKITAHMKNRFIHYFYEIETFDLIYSKGIDEYGRVIYEGKIIPS